MSEIVKYSSSSPKPNPHGRSRIGLTLVCGYFFFPPSNIPSIHHFLLLLLFRILIFVFWAASLSSFLAASPSEEKKIVVSTNSNASSNTNTNTNTSICTISLAATFSSSPTSISDTSSHTRHPLPSQLDHLRVAIGVSLSAFLFAVMALFACFRFVKLRRRKQYNLESVEEKGTIIHPTPNPNPNDGIGHGTSIIRFTWDEMERFTSNFSSVIGSGGYSTVYLAQFRDSSLGALKIHSSSSERLNRVYKQELEILLGLRHDNIVKLLGYCDDREEGVLVFEYAPNGNLQEKLHSGSTAAASVLSWRSRIKIAFQLAQALEYLHDKCPLQIVHGDIKASNILLDQQFNCKLCDFGSAKMGFSSTVLPPSSSAMNRMMMLGSPGYTDPHYLRTGIASKKNDVYSFGVIVLELITGREALCSRTGERLTSVAGPILRDASKVSQMVDARLLPLQEDKFNGGFDLLEEVKAMASISAMCLCDSPTLRPSASDIVNAMRSKILSALSFSVSTLENKF